MTFYLPKYSPPDFSNSKFANAPLVRTEPAPKDGVAPDSFHATSNHPEYIHTQKNEWFLIPESRMDCVIVVQEKSISVTEARKLKKGDPVVVGRTEDGEDGILVYSRGFRDGSNPTDDKFSFRTRGTRETPFSRSYDHLYDILRYDRKHGYIVWVLGPAVAFDKDSRNAMQRMVESGFCDALMAGNALATHDLEAGYFRTGLGQDIYSQSLLPLGHYHHLDILNTVRGSGSIPNAIQRLGIKDGIIYACEKHSVPYVLAGSIRDDGPLPEVFANAYDAQDAMRIHARRATTVVALATQLHSIAFGNMVPSYHIEKDATVRPVYFYIIDMSEFSADKLANRGSAQATAILTNVQDFMINLWNNLAK